MSGYYTIWLDDEPLCEYIAFNKRYRCWGNFSLPWFANTDRAKICRYSSDSEAFTVQCLDPVFFSGSVVLFIPLESEYHTLTVQQSEAINDPPCVDHVQPGVLRPQGSGQ